jgi:hypothetical protein
MLPSIGGPEDVALARSSTTIAVGLELHAARSCAAGIAITAVAAFRNSSRLVIAHPRASMCNEVANRATWIRGPRRFGGDQAATAWRAAARILGQAQLDARVSSIATTLS